MTDDLAIGIDLGTTFSCVSHYKNGRPELIPNDQGERLIPSTVYFDPEDGKAYVGRIAYDLSAHCIGNCLLDAKRYIGRQYEDHFISRYTEKNEVNYSLIRAPDGQVAFEIEILKHKVIKKPEEVSAEVLKYLKESASNFLGKSVTKAVISVPAYFSNAQRTATKLAAELAGLDVLRLVTEPTAAAIFYTSDKEKQDSNVLTFDFGGGTLDVSLIKVKDDTFEVKAVYGDTLLGGRDFDSILFQHFSKEMFNSENKIILTERLKRRLHNMCIKLKKNLSVKETYTLYLDRYAGNADLEMSMRQKEFEQMGQGLFNRIMDVLDLCMDDSGLTKTDVDEVILVGGSTRIPKIKRMLSSYFEPEKIKTDLNPDEAVAAGASIYAAAILGSHNLEKYKVSEVTPLSIGFSLKGGRMKIAIPRNSPIPTKSSVSTVSSSNDQTTLTSKIYEGERKIAIHNNYLGEVTITGFPKKRAGDVKFLKTFHLDENGILSVTSTENSTGNNNKLVVTMGQFRLSDKKIESCLQDAKKYKDEDEIFNKFFDFKCDVEKYSLHVIYDIKNISLVEDQNFVKERSEKFLKDIDAPDFTEIEKLKVIYAQYKESVTYILQKNSMLELLKSI